MGVTSRQQFFLFFLVEGMSEGLSLGSPNTEMIPKNPVILNSGCSYPWFPASKALKSQVHLWSLLPDHNSAWDNPGPGPASSSQTPGARYVSELRMYFRKVIRCTHRILHNTLSGLWHTVQATALIVWQHHVSIFTPSESNKGCKEPLPHLHAGPRFMPMTRARSRSDLAAI